MGFPHSIENITALKKKDYLHILLLGIGFLFVLALLLLASSSVTGRVHRSYITMDPEDQVEIAGGQYRVSEIATIYQPQIHIRPDTPSPPLLWTWYEAVPTDLTIDFIYYHVWENEINPNPWIDKLYSLFRAAYYGYPLYDIEYLQVTISRETGEVIGIRFETSPGNDYFVTVSEHVIARYKRRPDGFYDQVRMDQSGRVLSSTMGENIIFSNHHILVMAQTWNHLTRLVRETDRGLIGLATSLKPLSTEQYAQFKFVRKSQGDHQTKENRLSIFLTAVSSLLLLSVPATVIVRLFRKKSAVTTH